MWLSAEFGSLVIVHLVADVGDQLQFCKQHAQVSRVVFH